MGATGPIVLAGIDRSGIGILGELLDAHPDVATIRRANFWSFFADRFGDLADAQALDSCLAAMMSYTRIGRLGLDADALRETFQTGDRTYARLFRLVGEHHAARQGKTRWCDKSLGAERHADEIMSAYPDATMIHVVRDPRDRFASQADHRSAGLGGVGSGTAAWSWSAEMARRSTERYPDRYRAVRYEDLVAAPETTLQALCDHVGLPFSTSMVQAAVGDGRQLHSGSVGRHTSDLTTGQIRFIERMAAAEMARWAYEPGRPQWSRSQRWAFAPRLAPAVGGMVLWRPWSRLREAVAGPSARRLA
jgi:hypothetical protein